MALAEGITGIAASKREDLALSIGHIFQTLRARQFLNTLFNEENSYKEKGRINDDYQYTEQHKACLPELLDSLDKDMPDEITLYFLNNVFLVAGTKTVKSRKSFFPQ